MRQFISFDEHAVFPWKIPPPARMREQDFMTMFDEGGCILMTSESFSLPFIFGHAVYERMTLGDKNLSMCTVNIKCNDSFFALESKLQNEFIDDNLSKLLSDRRTYNTNTPFYSLSIATALDYYNFYRNKVPLTQN